MLNIRDLEVHYGSIAALRGVSLEVQAGEIVGVIGPNGAGKSTLLNAVAGSVKATEGAIEFEGESTLGRAPESIVRLGVSLVPEGRHIFTRLTVAENLQLGATFRRDRSAVNVDMASTLDLFPVLKQYFRSHAGKLSGGEQQMLAIARALLARPRLLMLDEPSLGLAPIVVGRVFETMEQLRQRGVTILLVEQNAARTIELADRVYVLRSGRVEFSGIREDFGDERLRDQVFLGFGKPIGD